MNIIWQRPDGSLAVSTIFDGSDPAEHAALLHERGDIPTDWTAVAFGDVEFPANWPRQEDWRFVGGKIVADPSLVKATKWEMIKAERDRRIEHGGYLVGAKWFHSDQKSRSQQLRLVMMGGNIPANLQWKTMDGTFVIMTQQLAGQVLAAAAASDQAIFAAAESHRQAMSVSADPAAYDFSTGWPKVFGE